MTQEVLARPPILGGYYDPNKSFLLDEKFFFVFGSNLKGIHGAGAAKVAAKCFGAKFGVGEGYIGRSYAIPTKIDPKTPRRLNDVKESIKRFVSATDIATLGDPDEDHRFFFVTAVGCGLAGFKHEEIAPLFRGAVNCWFPETWRPFLGDYPGLYEGVNPLTTQGESHVH